MSDSAIVDLPSDQIIAEAQAYAQQLGIFDAVGVHGPLNAPTAGTSAALWVARIRPVPKASGLDGVAVMFTLNLRIYVLSGSEPLDDVDVLLVRAMDQTMKAFANGFTLQGLVRNIDLLGGYGTPFDGVLGYAEIQNTVYRVATITIPCVVNDVWEEEE